jgi:hypothetical protein
MTNVNNRYRLLSNSHSPAFLPRPEPLPSPPKKRVRPYVDPKQRKAERLGAAIFLNVTRRVAKGKPPRKFSKKYQAMLEGRAASKSIKPRKRH